MTASLSLGGYTAATFGVAERSAFSSAIAGHLSVRNDAVTVTGVRDLSARRRSRELLQTAAVAVDFTVRTPTQAAASALSAQIVSTTSSTASSSQISLAAALRTGGLTAVQSTGLVVQPVMASVLVFATPPLPSSPPSPPPPPPPSPPPSASALAVLSVQAFLADSAAALSSANASVVLGIIGNASDALNGASDISSSKADTVRRAGRQPALHAPVPCVMNRSGTFQTSRRALRRCVPSASLTVEPNRAVDDVSRREAD